MVNFNLAWDCSVIDLMVPGKKTRSLWSSRASQLVRKIRNQNRLLRSRCGHFNTDGGHGAVTNRRRQEIFSCTEGGFWWYTNSFILNSCQIFGAMYLNFGDTYLKFIATYLNFDPKLEHNVFSKVMGGIGWIPQDLREVSKSSLYQDCSIHIKRKHSNK